VTDPNTDVNPPRLRSVILGQLQFIVRLDTGEERLFNALTDPAGKTNLAGTSTREAALQQLRDTLRLGVRDPRPPSVH
jgi:hypothetical protein